jgi:hypothetical protein
MNKLKEKVTSDNCQVCSKEYFSYQIRPSKIGSKLVNACVKCVSNSDALEYFKHSAQILKSLAQDANINSLNIIIEPFHQVLKDATEILKIRKPDFFIGVGKIKAGPSSSYGHVSSDDPSSLNVNIQRILNESGGKVDSLNGIISAVATIAHERAHSKDFNDKIGFPGGENVAENEEKAAIDWLKSNMTNPAVSQILSKYHE